MIASLPVVQTLYGTWVHSTGTVLELPAFPLKTTTKDSLGNPPPCYDTTRLGFLYTLYTVLGGTVLYIHCLKKECYV